MDLLVVDDCLPQCRAWAWFVREHDISISFAHSVAEARSVLTKHAFDIVFIDFYLGDGTGDMLLPDLDRLPVRPKAIAHSAHLNAEIVARFVGRTVACVPTPCEPSAFVHLIKEVAKMDSVEDEIEKFKKFFATHHLSPRQAEVLRCAMDGLTAKETAERLVVGIRTVEDYWQRIFDKTGRRSRDKVLALLRKKLMLPADYTAR